MIKSIIKEIIIMLLLCVAILLILGILLYDYIPNNKVIPAKEAYSTPENVKTEIEEEITEVEKTEISYEITDADLNIYKKSSSYKPGKANPFALVAEENVDTNSTTNTGNTDNTGNTQTDANQNTEVSSNSTNTFFNDTK